MFSPSSSAPVRVSALGLLDRIVIAYVALPLGIFVATWYRPWIAVVLLACIAYALRSLLAPLPTPENRVPVTHWQLGVALAVGCGWSILGGTDHVFFANADWHIRDAVLHDLVSSQWPVGYGLLDGAETVLRAPLAYYLPAALVGGWLGLAAAHAALAVWTAVGTTLFLLQVMSLTPTRPGAVLMAAAVIVFFSGMDIVGNLLMNGPHFRSEWSPVSHLEWWAVKYQYSSLTTALFWVPNHALAGWLTIGMLSRHKDSLALETLLPLLVVAVALWSPLTAIGLVPFVLWNVSVGRSRASWMYFVHPRVWAPALVVGACLAAYFVLDVGGIPKGSPVADSGGQAGFELLQHLQFFLLEAGIVGAAILAIHRSPQTVIALIVLALLPLVSFGPANDLVMRASIPALAVLAIAAAQALSETATAESLRVKKGVLIAVLIVGAVTPAEEFARAILLTAWPVNLQATLIGAACGRSLPHYIARLNRDHSALFLRPPQRIALGPQGPEACDNPGEEWLWRKALVPRTTLNFLPPDRATACLSHPAV